MFRDVGLGRISFLGLRSFVLNIRELFGASFMFFLSEVSIYRSPSAALWELATYASGSLDAFCIATRSRCAGLGQGKGQLRLSSKLAN